MSKIYLVKTRIERRANRKTQVVQGGRGPSRCPSGVGGPLELFLSPRCSYSGLLDFTPGEAWH